MSRTLDSLLDQIDNISDIATSFSDFANMPMPQNELVELTSVVHKAADLYADDKRVSIRRQIENWTCLDHGRPAIADAHYDQPDHQRDSVCTR